MGSLWAYIEGMDGLHHLFTGANSSDLAAWARFGTWDLFDGRLLLQNSWMYLNSLQHVCACYLGPMRSLWAHIEGMDGLCLLFTGANSSNLAAWARFGTLDLFDGRLLLQNSWMYLNSLQHVCACYLGPMRSLWAHIE